MVKGPTVDITAEGESAELSYETSSSFGFGIGGGLLINQKIIINLNYLDLGEPELSGEITASGQNEKLDSYDQPVSLLLISVGFVF